MIPTARNRQDEVAGQRAVRLTGLLPGHRVATIVQHYILHFWLWRTQLVSFLEDAMVRMLIRRVGREYSFTHCPLLEYFADLNTTLSSGLCPEFRSPNRPDLYIARDVGIASKGND